MYSSFVYEPGIKYCGVIFDNFLCWPPTRAGNLSYQACPPIKTVNEKGFAFRECGGDGVWKNRDNSSAHVEWTNYTDCFPRSAKDIIVKIMESNAEEKFTIMERTRYIEIAGFCTSLIALIISLIIFQSFRCLRNKRTKIHKNLFIAMSIQVFVRLTLYTDQAIVRYLLGDYALYKNSSFRSIENMPYLCEVFYIMLEYGNTAMFMWMFIEGLFLQKVATTSVMKHSNYDVFFYTIGWGLPLVSTGLWAVIYALYFGPHTPCWWGYNFSVSYWILEVPRLAVILINLVFLLNVIRLLITKMKNTKTSDMQKAKKSVRAALVLLPLLGTINILMMTQPPVETSVWQFALWCYSTYFLTSFQGFFIATLYCFLNGEVRTAVRKYFQNCFAMREESNGILFFITNYYSDTFRNSRRRGAGNDAVTRQYELKRLASNPDIITPTSEGRNHTYIE